MTNNKEDKPSNHAKNFILFESKEQKRPRKILAYSFESVDQENRIKLITDFKPYGGHYLYTIELLNESFASITDVKMKIFYSNFLTITRNFPPTLYIPGPVIEGDSFKISIDFDEINERSQKDIQLHFSPLSLGHRGEIKTIVTFVNSKDFIRVVNSDPVELLLDEITIIPKIIPSTYIREFSQIPGMKRAIISMGVGTSATLNPEIYFNLLEQVFLRNNLQLISKDKERMILWYFGAELESKDDVLLIGQIVSNKIELIGTSKNHQVLISFITLFSNKLREEIIARGIVDSLDRIHDLDCKFCGTVLPYFPRQDEEIQCNKCKYEQIVW
ncbi:MAG: hypothetical protein ACFFEO_17705 [Candidatus Thorarchaeota archaeon]